MAELGRRITADYAGRPPLLVGVLKGAFVFMSDLARAIDLPVEFDFMAVASYGSSHHAPAGVVRIVKDLDSDLSGRHVLVVEDIVDSGLTLPSSGATCWPASRPASRSAPCWSRRVEQPSGSTCATSVSPSRPISWSATASTWPSATATCAYAPTRPPVAGLTYRPRSPAQSHDRSRALSRGRRSVACWRAAERTVPSTWTGSRRRSASCWPPWGRSPTATGCERRPARVARMYAEIFSGSTRIPGAHLTVTFEADHDEMVLVRDIPLSSCASTTWCRSGKAHVAYIPADGRITGLSKLARLVDGFAKRPQVQERITTQIADALGRAPPQGALVVVEAEHLCMSMRGVEARRRDGHLGGAGTSYQPGGPGRGPRLRWPARRALRRGCRRPRSAGQKVMSQLPVLSRI